MGAKNLGVKNGEKASEYPKETVPMERQTVCVSMPAA